MAGKTESVEMEVLARAAEAAGFAMATVDDDEAATPRRNRFELSVEDRSRAQDANPSAQPHDLRDRVASSVTTVRDTVYGYLGLGLPA